MWKYDYDRKSEIEKQILESLIGSFRYELNLTGREAELLAKHILHTHIEVIPPMYYDEPPKMEMIIYRSNGFGGRNVVSHKPANITYDQSKLINAITDSSLAVAATLGGMTWVIPLAVARVAYNVAQATKIELTEVEGYITETIHRYYNEGENYVEYEILFRQVNIQLLNKIGRTLSKNEFDVSLNKLSEIKVISHSHNRIKLLEDIKYSLK